MMVNKLRALLKRGEIVHCTVHGQLTSKVYPVRSISADGKTAFSDHGTLNLVCLQPWNFKVIRTLSINEALQNET